jgi:hypothetical protein
MINREVELNRLLDSLHTKHIFDIKEELEDFLHTDTDNYTKKLRDAIGEKLSIGIFYHDYFSDFLKDYHRDNQTDPSDYSTLNSEINGGDDESEG